MTDHNDDELSGGAIRVDSQPVNDYFSDAIISPNSMPAMSASLAVEFFKHSPARALYTAQQERAGAFTRAMAFGTVAHSVILRQEGWEDSIAVLQGKDNWRTKEAQAFRDGAIARGQTPITEKELEQIYSMRNQWTETELIKFLVCDGSPEVSVYWRCPETYAVCKVRWDFLPAPALLQAGWPAIDYKSTSDLIDWPRKNVQNYHLALRAALYAESLEQLAGEPQNMLYAVQEKDAPHQIQCHSLMLKTDDQNRPPSAEAMEFIEVGKAQLKKVKIAFAECQKSGKWQHRKELVAFHLPTSVVKNLAEHQPAQISERIYQKG